MQFDDIKNHIIMQCYNLENSPNSYKLLHKDCTKTLKC